MLLFRTLYLSKNSEKMYHSFHKFHNSTVFNIDNNQKCFFNQHIRIISEGSCDTEDWRNDAENSALHYRNQL